jgi:outer membrane receptor protein involved in Fe transport
VPLNLFGPDGSVTDAMLAFIDPAAVSFRTRTSLGGVSASITGDFGWAIPLATNPVGIALGAEYRDYSAAIQPDLPSRTDNEVLGAGGAVQPVDGRYDVKEVFAELIAPLIEDRDFFHSLTLEAGIRYSDYSISGGSTAWKIGGSWEPIPSLKFRGIYQQAVRAPNIGELFTPRSLGLANSDTDPCQGTLPVGNAQLTQACIASGAPASQIGNIAPPSAGQINITFGGNLDLEPEDARTITIGAVFTPDFLPGFSATVDYYDILITNAITAPNVDDLFNACYVQFDLAVCDTIGRNPLNGSLNGGAETPGLPLFLSNSGRIDTSGLDISLNYRRDLGFGRIDIGFIANYTFDQKFQATPNSINRECVGFYSVNCGLSGSLQPEFQFNQRTTLSIGNLDISYLWRHIDSVEVEPLVADNFLEDFRRIGSVDYFDLAFRAEVSDQMTFLFTVANIFDKKPPIVGNTIGATAFNSGNTYPSTYDAIGRRYSAAVRLRF